MTYAFSPDRPFTEDFRAVGAELIERAVAALEDQPAGVHEAIHDARRNFKRLRSLYRLVASDAPALQKQENARIREMARNLSPVRDAAALVENASYLRAHASNEEQRSALDHVCAALAARRDRISEDETDIAGKIATTVANCQQALAALAHVSFDDGKRKTAGRLEKGWRRTLRRAARARVACETGTDAALFHELRKRTQDYRMHLALLRGAWPSAMQAKRADAKELVDVLGHLNDLADMTSLINEQPEIAGSSQNQAHLLSAVIHRQEELRREALQRAQAVFGDRPEDESRTVGLLWLEAGR
ncbi:CHAD domain-containing protein [Sinorhizobium numidicum]|uniref:CHAD domain-containing protein n=1 Tax=Sinorhizobium numidicum TaxID=680248 RepID=A0ABY8CYL7_9HYPH|nr:CHAD domain-containing protein [Sinorhizobium numidicum]WEX77071.1 CHAD domain-containing protein [Sinorhizobium numidicum]WEX83730.1 CHAD domain-containing protein [Sinorhizobium numidicum]